MTRTDEGEFTQTRSDAERVHKDRRELRLHRNHKSRRRLSAATVGVNRNVSLGEILETECNQSEEHQHTSVSLKC